MRTIRLALAALHAVLVVLEMYAKTTDTEKDDAIVKHLLNALDSLDEFVL